MLGISSRGAATVALDEALLGLAEFAQGYEMAGNAQNGKRREKAPVDQVRAKI